MRYVAAFVSLFCLLIVPAAHAGPITLSYKSGPFVDVPTVFPEGITALSALFTVPDLPANVTDYLSPITLWSMSDGRTSVNGDYLLTAMFSTNGSSEITDVYVKSSRSQPPTSLTAGSNLEMVFRQNPAHRVDGVCRD